MDMEYNGQSNRVEFLVMCHDLLFHYPIIIGFGIWSQREILDEYQSVEIRDGYIPLGHSTLPPPPPHPLLRLLLFLVELSACALHACDCLCV